MNEAEVPAVELRRARAGDAQAMTLLASRSQELTQLVSNTATNVAAHLKTEQRSTEWRTP